MDCEAGDVSTLSYMRMVSCSFLGLSILAVVTLPEVLLLDLAAIKLVVFVVPFLAFYDSDLVLLAEDVELD